MGVCLNALGRQPDEQHMTSAGEADEARLVAAILRKDRKATAEFVARYADAVYAYVRSRLAPQYDLADDLVQEVLLAAWENLHQYRGASALQAWVMGIARHKVEDHYRARLRAPEPRPINPSFTCCAARSFMSSPYGFLDSYQWILGPILPALEVDLALLIDD